jgi:hypothetical protein
MPRREKLHPDLLLCETCGYRLDDINPSLPCPECGTPVAASLPAQRPGSRWQRKPGPIAYIATNWATVRHPVRRWRVVTPRQTTGLLALNCFLIGAALAIGLGAPSLLDGFDQEILGISGLTILAAPFVLFSLSKIEALGLRVLGARNGWRTTKEVSNAIVAHASIGWLLSFPALVAEIIYFRTINFPTALAWISAPWWWEALAWAFAPLVGLFGFELLAWLGWRKMKFANRATQDPKEGV